MDGIPVLLGSERFVPTGSPDALHPVPGLNDPVYTETHEEEIEYYNAAESRRVNLAVNGAAKAEYLEGIIGCKNIAAARSFPEPDDVWIEAGNESLCLFEAYRHLAPVGGKTFMQIGGTGSHSVKMLLAGAERGFLLTPMIEEARYALCLAEIFGVRDRFAPVVGLGEQIPFKADFFDSVFSFACFHHTRLEYVSGELYRVLQEGGKFAGTDPWKTLLHTIGTRMLGKQERDVHCRPITEERLAALERWFPDMTVNWHGPLLRYLRLGLQKLCLDFLPKSEPAMMKTMRADDFLGLLTGMKGGVIVMMGVKPDRNSQPTSKN